MLALNVLDKMKALCRIWGSCLCVLCRHLGTLLGATLERH